MSYLVLLRPLMERMVLIWFVAYLFSQTAVFWNMVRARTTKRDYVFFVLLFSAIAIAGTYIGIPLDDGAIANIRPLGAIVAGLIGGPWLGAAVGLIAGAHRWYLGGITGFACGLATIFEGLSGGLLHMKYKHNYLNVRVALMAGILGELAQIGFVLLFTKPFEKAVAIETVVALPMIIVNTIGVIGFIIVIKDVFTKHNGMIISQFNRFVEIERSISQALDKGLNKQTAGAVLEELMHRTELKGIFLIQGHTFASFRGPQSELLAVEALQDTLSPEGIGRIKLGSHKNSPSYYCVAIENPTLEQPLFLGIRMTGRAYFDTYIMQFAKSLAELTENQLAANQAKDLQQKMAEAQLRTLKAQIQPHFLFNALSTISSLCRTDGSQARQLILDLASYFRSTIESDNDFHPIAQELEQVQAYLRIEHARMRERLEIEYNVSPICLETSIPTYLLQPLIENAIKHGIAKLTDPGQLHIVIQPVGQSSLCIRVSNTTASEICPSGGCGQALKNIKSRLKLLYGNEAEFKLWQTEVLTHAEVILPLGGAK